jgi:hypothetical protein
MRLHEWNSMSHDIEFDPRTGSSSRIELPDLRPDTAIPTGVACFETRIFGPREVFALYRRGDAVCFSAGARYWPLAQPGLRFEHEHPYPFFSRFRVLESDEEVYSFLYMRRGARLFLEIFDPTYDSIDEEGDHLLVFVTRYATSPEWQALVRERWACEPVPEGS